jgi:hypothetical protein
MTEDELLLRRVLNEYARCSGEDAMPEAMESALAIARRGERAAADRITELEAIIDGNLEHLEEAARGVEARDKRIAELEAALRKAKKALASIALQHKVNEQDELGDIEYGYDSIVDIARVSLAAIEKAG